MNVPNILDLRSKLDSKNRAELISAKLRLCSIRLVSIIDRWEELGLSGDERENLAAVLGAVTSISLMLEAELEVQGHNQLSQESGALDKAQELIDGFVELCKEFKLDPLPAS